MRRKRPKSGAPQVDAEPRKRIGKRGLRDVVHGGVGEIHGSDGVGFQHVGTWSFEAASNMISRIAAQGWRGVPRGVDPQTYVPPKPEPAADPWLNWGVTL